MPCYHQVDIAASASAVAGESPFNEVCSPLIRWLAVAGGFTHLQIAGTIIIAIFNTPVMMGNTHLSPITVPPYWWKMYSTWFYSY